MPNFKIFQDNPDQARIKVFGGNNVAVNTDTAGNVGITSTGLAITGIVDVGDITITTGSGSLSVSVVNEVTVTSTGLAVTGIIDVGTVTVTSSGLAITGIVDVGTVTVTSSGLAVTGTVDVSGTVTVTTGSGSLNVCIPDVVGISIEDHGVTDLDETIETGSATFSGATPQVILDQNAWTFAVKNISADPNDALVQIQLSATANDESDWLDETLPVTLSQNELSFLTTSLLVKYARVYYAAVSGGDDVTLSVIFQAQK